MPSPTRKIAKPKRELSIEQLPRYVEEYLKEKAAADAMAKRVNEKKATIAALVEASGYLDDRGSQFLDVGIDGCSAVKRERRITNTLDEAKALAWLTKHGLYDECTRTEVVLDEEALLAAAYEGKVPERALKSFYEQSESFAFKVLP